MSLATFGAASAHAAISQPVVLAGPSSSVISVGNTAMAQDDTGGMIWTQIKNGEPHVFASRFADSQWSAPIQVDAGQAGPATFPQIAAADNGELLAVWVQPYASISNGGASATTVYQLESAVLAPGSNTFSQPVQVDSTNVGDGTGVYPQLAMSPSGSAYIAYRVVTNSLAADQAQPAGTPAPMRPGDELVDVRLARFNGLTWSSLGKANVYPGEVTMREPTAANAPEVAITPSGQGMVVWQEPTVDGVARIWARRLYGTTMGDAQQISPTTLNGEPVSADADAPALALGSDASAQILFRLQGGSGSPLAGPAELFSSIGAASDPNYGASFAAATVIASGTAAGIPSAGAGTGNSFNAAYTLDGMAYQLLGGGTSNNAPQSLGTASGDPVSSLAGSETNGNTVAWPSTSAGLPVLDVRETFPNNSVETGSLSAPVDGTISQLTIGASPYGDALIGFQEGSGSTTEVVGVAVQVPPQVFTLLAPKSWVAPSGAAIYWTPALTSVGGVSYSVLLNGRTLATGLTDCGAPVPSGDLTIGSTIGALACYYQIPAADLGTGNYSVTVVASDADGQRQAFSAASLLRVDATPPRVATAAHAGRRVTVRITDPYSGVQAKSTSINFGDGTATVRGRKQATHRYSHSGVFTVIVKTSSNTGRHGTYHLAVKVR